MKKEKAKMLARKKIQSSFYNWCEQKKLNPDPDAFIKFDEENNLKLLDYDRAKKDGFYAHLRMQAAAIISSWASVVPLRVNAGSVPLPAAPTQRNVRLQAAYDLPGQGQVRVEKMTVGQLKLLIEIFRIESENKLARMYIISERLGRLEQTRKEVRDIFATAEQRAFDSVA